MILIAASREDVASVNIRDRLLEGGEWDEAGTFDGEPAYHRPGQRLVTLRGLHLHRDHVDRAAADSLGQVPDLVVFPSRHSSQSGVPSFTVHPLGNYGGEAPYGGKPRTLVPTAPHWMTEALRLLKAGAEGFEHQVTFEATHHGPYLETPAFFIELGSDATAWEDEAAARVVADALLALRPREAPVALGVGGGHYVPRMTDLALSRRISFGHLIPAYAARDLDPTAWRQAVALTPGAAHVYVHRKTLKGEVRRRMEALVAGSGLQEVHARDLDPLGATLGKGFNRPPE